MHYFKQVNKPCIHQPLSQFLGNLVYFSFCEKCKEKTQTKFITLIMQWLCYISVCVGYSITRIPLKQKTNIDAYQILSSILLAIVCIICVLNYEVASSSSNLLTAKDLRCNKAHFSSTNKKMAFDKFPRLESRFSALRSYSRLSIR